MEGTGGLLRRMAATGLSEGRATFFNSDASTCGDLLERPSLFCPANKNTEKRTLHDTAKNINQFGKQSQLISFKKLKHLF